MFLLHSINTIKLLEDVYKWFISHYMEKGYVLKKKNEAAKLRNVF